MDLSKLPRMSQTPASPPQSALDQSPPPPPIDYDRYERASIAPQVWISAIVGVIFLLIGWNFARYAAATLSGRTYDTGVVWSDAAGEKAGTPVTYPELQGRVMWSDSAMFIFGVALLLEAAALLAVGLNLRGQRPLIVLGFAVALLATIYNIIVASMLFNDGILPIYSLLAVAFGGFITLQLWRLLPRRGEMAMR